MSDIFERARLKQVYFTVGTFRNEPQRKKRIKAPFDLIDISGNTDSGPETYLMPTPRFCELESNSGLTIDDADSTEFLTSMANGITYFTGDNIVIEPHQMGDMSDTWRGLHAFGYI